MSVDSILALGDDQLASQYQIVFPAGIPGGGNTEAISLRLDQAFEPEDEQVGTYEIKSRGMKILKTNMQDASSKEFTIIVRIDQQWKVFDDLYAWKQMTYDSENGVAMSDTMIRTTVAVQALDANNEVVKTITYKNAKLKGMKLESFENSSEDPLRATLSFIYGSLTYS